MIASGVKTIETRTWATKWRGPILICASAHDDHPDESLPRGVALCTVDVVDCRPMTVNDEPSAGCPIYDRAKAWELENVILTKPFKVRGKPSLFNVEVATDDLWDMCEHGVFDHEECGACDHEAFAQGETDGARL